jgi:DNA-binding MarR family transcriptional regulator
MTDPDFEPLVDALAELRARAARLVLARQERRKDGATPGERMSTPQHVALLALADGPLAISDLAAATGVAVSTATRMVQALEREGWVERAPAEPGGDRRRRPVALTPAGRAVMDEATAVVKTRVRRLLVHLDAGERRAVIAGLQAFTKAIQADDMAAGRATAASNSSTVGAGGARGEAPSGRIPSSTTPR